MSWRDAPLYVEAHDLAAWILGRVDAWSALDGRHLSLLTADAACDLVDGVALALTFPETRAAHLERADAAIVVLRTRLRLARQLDLLSARGLRFACGRLREIGRMVGGWRKRVATPDKGPSYETISGDRPPAASA